MCAQDKTHTPAITQLRYWEKLQRDVAAKRTALIESEQLDRVERLQYLLKEVLPMDDLKAFKPAPFTAVHYARRLNVTSLGRAKRHATLAAKQAACSVAHELLISFATTASKSGRVVLLNALVTLRKEFVESRKRKRDDGEAGSDADDEIN